MSRMLSCAAVCCVLAAGAPIAGNHATGENGGVGIVAMQLTEIKELRQVRLSGDASTSMGFDRPGLTLTLGLNLPAEATLVELRQPKSLRAVDSTGLDLTEVEANFAGKREYLRVVHAWEGDPKEATLHLALPQREAKTVSVAAEIEAIVCSGTEQAQVAAAGSPAALRTDVAGFPDARMHVERKNGQLQVIVTPGAVKPWIKDVAVIAGGSAHESRSSMWSDDRLVYFIEAPAGAEADAVRLTVRRDLRAIPVRLDLPSITLP